MPTQGVVQEVAKGNLHLALQLDAPRACSVMQVTVQQSDGVVSMNSNDGERPITLHLSFRPTRTLQTDFVADLVVAVRTPGVLGE